MKLSYDEWRDELLRFWPDTEFRGDPVVRARSLGIVVGEWSGPWVFWVKTPSYKSACVNSERQHFGIWEETIGGIGRRA